MFGCGGRIDALINRRAEVTFKVTAKKGSTLNFVCAVHPWMLAKIKVK